MLGKKINVDIIVFLIKKVIQLLEVAKMFNTKIKFLPPRKGERYASALTNMNLSNKVYKLFGKIKLKDYIKNN
jgi:UDP-glucose 4-epimerase